jgi:thiol-disulfide isomerase/thioredoxin
MNLGPAEPEKVNVARRRPWVGLAILGAAAVLYALAAGCSKPADLKGLATGPMIKLSVPASPGGQPDAPFTGPDGKTLHLADLKGQVVMVNFWATWCAPCKEEMPSLAQLQKDYAGKPFKVIPISVDKPEQADAAKDFLKNHGGLGFYNDPQYALVFGLNPRPEGIPVTVIYDRQGRERARLAGGADWSTEQAKKVVDYVLAQKG